MGADVALPYAELPWERPIERVFRNFVCQHALRRNPPVFSAPAGKTRLETAASEITNLTGMRLAAVNAGGFDALAQRIAATIEEKDYACALAQMYMAHFNNNRPTTFVCPIREIEFKDVDFTNVVANELACTYAYSHMRQMIGINRHSGVIVRYPPSFAFSTANLVNLLGGLFFTPTPANQLTRIDAQLYTEVTNAYMVVLHAAVVRAGDALRISEEGFKRFVHVCTGQDGAFDDRRVKPSEYQAGKVDKPVIALVCKSSATHYWCFTNFGAEPKKATESFLEYYRRVYDEKLPGLVSFDTYVGTGMHATDEKSDYGRLPPALRWPLTFEQLAQPPWNEKDEHNPAPKEARLDNVFKKPPWLMTMNYGPPVDIIHQRNGVDCGLWACFLAFNLTQIIMETWDSQKERHTLTSGEMISEMKNRCKPKPENEKLREPIFVDIGADEPYFFALANDGTFKGLYTTRLRYAVLKSIMIGRPVSFYDFEPIEFGPKKP